MYDLMCSGELVTAPSSKAAKPHLDATTLMISCGCRQDYEMNHLRTEDLVANVVLSDEVSEKLLVDTGLVDDLRPKEISLMFEETTPLRLTYRSIPKGAAKLQRLEQYWLSLFEGEVVSQAKADTHCTYRAEDSSQHNVSDLTQPRGLASEILILAVTPRGQYAESESRPRDCVVSSIHVPKPGTGTWMSPNC